MLSKSINMQAHFAFNGFHLVNACFLSFIDYEIIKLKRKNQTMGMI
jgi:hypothetical protein